ARRPPQGPRVQRGAEHRRPGAPRTCNDNLHYRERDDRRPAVRRVPGVPRRLGRPLGALGGRAERPGRGAAVSQRVTAFLIALVIAAAILITAPPLTQSDTVNPLSG